MKVIIKVQAMARNRVLTSKTKTEMGKPLQLENILKQFAIFHSPF
jgi:hypothetical protein